MFSGIVEDQGIVLDRRQTPAGLRLRVRFAKLRPKLKTGDSVAVNGVCLTAAALIPNGFEADVVPETLKSTTLGRLRAGDKINLERALRFGRRLGGHLVSGHVDGRGRILKIQRLRGARILRVGLPAGLRRFCRVKGSITLDGVSLTLQDAGPQGVKIALIPHTSRVTTLGALREGAAVNIEVERAAPAGRDKKRTAAPRESGRTLQRKIRFLKTMGF